MKYISTRDPSVSCTFEQAICSGYAPDGGLFVPEMLPSITSEILTEWSTLPYPTLTERILRLFVSSDEISDERLHDVCQSAFVGFADPAQAVPVIPLGPIFVAELFHGPTFCFKDLGMRAVVGLLSYFATKRQRPITLLVATTGDTGPAAVQAVSDLSNPLLTILVHYPEGQISDLQRKQLTTVESPCVRVATFQGGGDDMDKPIKSILATSLSQREAKTETAFQSRLLTGVNSYNIGRPLMQMVHFVWVYMRVCEMKARVSDTTNTGKDNFTQIVDIIVPTGAMGNLAGGFMAKNMGLPIGKLCAGVNVNDITHRVIQTGVFCKSPVMIKTLSDAINIQVPYNFERLLFYLAMQNHSQVKTWMANLDDSGTIDLDKEWQEKLQMEFSSARVDDDEMCETMRFIQGKFGYLADPHTAVALSAARQLGYLDCSINDSRTTRGNSPLAVVLATASPCKFKESVTEAIGVTAWKDYYDNGFPESARDLQSKPEITPTIYKAKDEVPLAHIQIEWERIALSIIAELSTV